MDIAVGTLFRKCPRLSSPFLNLLLLFHILFPSINTGCCFLKFPPLWRSQDRNCDQSWQRRLLGPGMLRPRQCGTVLGSHPWFCSRRISARWPRDWRAAEAQQWWTLEPVERSSSVSAAIGPHTACRPLIGPPGHS